MAVPGRRTLPVPYGHHVYVVADLALSPGSDPSGRALRELAELLNGLDDPAIVIVAGGLFAPPEGARPGPFVAETLSTLSPLARALRAFTERAGRQLIVLPGASDRELLSDPTAQGELAAHGVAVARDVVLQVATADDVRDVVVAAGVTDLDDAVVDARDRADARRVEDPSALARFAASRLLYRRLAAWVWLPVVAFFLLDVWSLFSVVADHLVHHHYRIHLLTTRSFWANLAAALVVVVAAETALAALAGWVVRRRFARRASAPSEPPDPLALTRVDGVDAVEFARRVVERGGAGAVVGGAPGPALAYLDQGMSASPGPSRRVLVERRGRFGLPPVFVAVERLGVVEIEAASTLRVRLLAGESNRVWGTPLERIVASAPSGPTPSPATSVVGAWPRGRPYPVSAERLDEQRHHRTIRRWVSWSILADGLLNVAVTTVRPLHRHLHLVLSVLPVAVAKSAAALTAVAGVALVMLARGLHRGQRRAWFLSAAILAVTLVAHALRGGTIVAIGVAAALLATLVIERDAFRAVSDRTSAAEAAPRLVLAASVAVLAATFGTEAVAEDRLPSLGVVVLACAERLVGITSIALPEGPSDFLDPVMLAVGVALVVATLYFVTRPVVDRRLSSAALSAERRLAERRARDIVTRHGAGTLDYFALRDDKQFFFFRDSLVAYAVYGGVALVSPDPIGPVAERAGVLGAFREFAQSHGWTVGVMGAGASWLPIYHAHGFHAIYLGDEAVVDCPSFSLAGQKMKGLRQACTRLERHGYTVEFLDPAHVEPERVAAVLELTARLRRGEGERGFSMMLGRLFDPKDRGLLLTIVNGPDGAPAAACQFVPAPGINGYSLDLMRRDPGEHPNGLIDYALCSTIFHLARRGAQGLSLNFAAFRSVLEDESGTVVTRMERWALRRLSGILPIESLWSFNAKYQPDWQPRYLVYPAAESFVPVAAATLRAESLTELPLLGRLLVHDPLNRPATVTPEAVLAAARDAGRGSAA
ncbi:MAG TPA: phosphatidylglycerol lysyltransferase domain-containing protein [Acidimicrobiales bacterium]|nr:phosphatidylglycerol lysyltransferase domain-containing protein [Acidimicrobiales bacterium]